MGRPAGTLASATNGLTCLFESSSTTKERRRDVRGHTLFTEHLVMAGEGVLDAFIELRIA